MNISTISYWFYEAFESMKKNMKNVLISVGSMIATMTIVAAGFLLSTNAGHVIDQMQDVNSKVLAFLEVDVTETQINNINTRLNAIDGVSKVEFFSQEESIKKAGEMEGMLTYGIEEEDLKELFPPFFRVTFESIEAEREIVETLEGMDGVGNSENDIGITQSADKTIKIAESVNIISITAMILIVYLSIFLMMNTTKLILYARRKEISIMKYVGAKDAFVKMPFAIEGIIMALIAVVIVLILTSICYEPIVSGIEASKSNYKCLALDEVMPNLRLLLLCLGVAIGAFGSTISMNKYLDV